jgi:hypothetical protein
MFKGKNRSKNNQEASSSRRVEVSNEIDINDIKLDTMRSRNNYTPGSEKNGGADTQFHEDAGSMWSRSGQSGSIGDVIDDKPKLHRGLKARHVSNKQTKYMCKFFF